MALAAFDEQRGSRPAAIAVAMRKRLEKRREELDLEHAEAPEGVCRAPALVDIGARECDAEPREDGRTRGVAGTEHIGGAALQRFRPAAETCDDCERVALVESAGHGEFLERGEPCAHVRRRQSAATRLGRGRRTRVVGHVGSPFTIVSATARSAPTPSR